MRKLAHLYWCVWNMDVNDSSFVEANDLQVCVDVDTDILTSQINMLDKIEDIERRSTKDKRDTLFRGSNEQSAGIMATRGSDIQGSFSHNHLIVPAIVQMISRFCGSLRMTGILHRD